MLSIRATGPANMTAIATIRPRLAMFAALSVAFIVPLPARAASLSGPITGWANGSEPNYIAMYEYVPDKVAANPPLLVVNHYCGGNASGVFGEAQGGGIVSAADKYGFIMVFPQTTNNGVTHNCWDVGSTASLTHGGGGDTGAIVDMVKYALTKHGANADRVYAIGTSSGAMMTEALLAVYPDVFKAGAEFAGVPAGCWAVQYSASSQWSGPCAGGQVTHTAQEWGDMVRNMDKGYSGYRPRIQLWHGMADATINFNNETEAIKEWTNVLGLSANPTSTTMVSLANHQWTRQSWQNSCGVTVLDAWAEQNGPHGTDANLNAQYVIPFLGLDKSGSVDPDVAACADGGAGSTGGTSSSDGGGGRTTGGAASTGTGSGTTTGGARGTTGANGSDGGAVTTSGASSTTGQATTSGAGITSSGASATGGTGSANENTGGNGVVSSGGLTTGSAGTGGGASSAASGTSTGAGTSGTTLGSAGSAGNETSDGGSSSGCSCRIGTAHPGKESTGEGMAFFAAIAGIGGAAVRRRRRRYR